MRLSLQQAIALATSPRGSAQVQLADAAVAGARARVVQARAERYPLFTASVSESNLTRNLNAEGFNFPTGVPNFTIPSEVGPFNVFDGRVAMTQTIFDLSAIRRSRASGAAFDAATADAQTNRDAAAAQAARDYLSALAADARAQTALASVEQNEAMLQTAQHDVEAGKAADVELTRAQLDLSGGRRKLSAAQNDAALARLQLLDDLGLDFNTVLDLTDALTFTGEDKADLEAQIALAQRTRPELKTATRRREQAQDEAEAAHAGLLPTVTAYGDVGPQNSVITHTVGISARVTVFDGGRRRAEEMESDAAMRQYEIQQRNLKRQIELEVRQAYADLENAASQAQECDAARKLAEEELAGAQRRYAKGIATNAELVDAERQENRAREDQVQAYLAWNRARLEMAQATGTVESFVLK